MNNEQMRLINEQLRFAGFNEHSDTDLDRFGDQEAFELEQTTRYRGQALEAILHFRKSKHYDVYFLSKHTLTLADKTQTFFMRQGKGITRKEGFNLLSGRAVYKKLMSEQGLEYFTWLQLNFLQTDENGYAFHRYYENYGFNIINALQQLGLTQFNAWEQSMLILSLQRGNRQPLIKDSVKVYLVANPRERIIEVHEANNPPSIVERHWPTIPPAPSRRKRIPIK